LFAAERGGVFVPDEVMANRDAEAALLGSMLQDAEVADSAIAKMTEDSFFYDSHRLVFKAIQTLRMQASAVDLVTITEALRTGGALELVGGASYISVLGNAVPTADNWEHYLRIVEENAILREIVKGAEEAKQQAQTKNRAAAAALLRRTLAVADEPTVSETAAAVEIREYSFDVSPGDDPEHLLTHYIGWASGLTDSASEYHELAGLILTGMALHGAKAIFGPYPKGLQANLYGLVIGDPARSRKSTATGFARDIAEDFLPGSCLSNWHSPEGFMQELAEQSHKPVLLSIDEFAGYADKLHHNKYMAGHKERLCSAYSGRIEEYRLTKKGAGENYRFTADDVGLNILACCTPGALFGNLTLADVQSGLLPRFAVAWPEGRPTRKPFYQLRDTKTTERNIIIARLNSIRQWAAPGRQVVFEGDSLELIDVNTKWIENIGEHDEALSFMVQRLSPMLVKLAMCISAGRKNVTAREALVVTPRDVRDALPILGRWASAAERFARELTASSHERLVRRALALLRDMGGRATRTAISRALREPADVLDRVEATLEERRHIVVITKAGTSDDPKRKAGRNITEWIMAK
jgi:hypothetical protein